MLTHLPLFTLIHVVLSLIGIVAGLVVVGGFMAGAHFRGWVGIFLTTTVLTDVTGFGFPFRSMLPSHIVGAVSLLVLAAAISALYWKRLAGGWRSTFIILSVMALYLNVFVLIVQLFQKTPALAVLGPDPSSPAFAATNLFVLLIFVMLGWASVKGARAQAGSR